MSPLVEVESIILVKASITNKKISGDKGFSWQIPLDAKEKSVGEPSPRIADEVEETQ